VFANRHIKVRGIVRSFQTNPAGSALNSPWAGTVHVWTFRLERSDLHANDAPMTSVELRGPIFEGLLRDGDDVEVTGAIRNGTLVAKELINYTSSPPSMVRATGKSVRNSLVAIGLTSVVVFGLISFLIASGVVRLLLAHIAESQSVPLSSCYVMTRSGAIYSRMMGMGVQVDLILSPLAIQRLPAYRRADIWFGSSAQFEVDHNGSRGWFNGMIERVEGDCLRTADDIAVQFSSHVTGSSTPSPIAQLLQLFPEVPERILNESERLEPPCVVSSFGFGLLSIDLYLEPSLFARKVGQLPAGTHRSVELYHSSGWYYIILDELSGWAPQNSLNVDCSAGAQVQPTPQSPQAVVEQQFIIATVELSTCVLESMGGFLKSRPAVGATVANLFPSIRNSYSLVATKRADARLGSWFEVVYQGQLLWLDSIFVGSMSGDCMKAG